MPREFIMGGHQDSRTIRDDSKVSFDRIAKQRVDGASDRDTSRTIGGALEQIPCREGLSCQQDRCMSRGPPSEITTPLFEAMARQGHAMIDICL